MRTSYNLALSENGYPPAGGGNFLKIFRYDTNGKIDESEKERVSARRNAGT